MAKLRVRQAVVLALEDAMGENPSVTLMGVDFTASPLDGLVTGAAKMGDPSRDRLGRRWPWPGATKAVVACLAFS